MAVIPATFIEFHSHSSTGNGGGVTRPSACSTLKPSASASAPRRFIRDQATGGEVTLAQRDGDNHQQREHNRRDKNQQQECVVNKRSF
jgi:hypothetical protein